MYLSLWLFADTDQSINFQTIMPSGQMGQQIRWNNKITLICDAVSRTPFSLLCSVVQYQAMPIMVSIASMMLVYYVMSMRTMYHHDCLQYTCVWHTLDKLYLVIVHFCLFISGFYSEMAESANACKHVCHTQLYNTPCTCIPMIHSCTIHHAHAYR